VQDADAGAGEPYGQPIGPAPVQFDGEHPRPGADQRTGEGAVAGSDVENEFAGADAGVGHDGGGPLVSERMPSPGPPGSLSRGHDAP
jgi:hypothetical protein